MFYHKVDKDILIEIIDSFHIDELYNTVMLNKDYLSENLPWAQFVNERSDIQKYIHSSKNKFSKENGFDCIIRYDGSLVGVIGFHEINSANDTASIGYWLAEKMQGKGIMTKSCKKMFEIAFKYKNVNKIFLRCSTCNMKSQNIAIRLGMKKLGVLPEHEKFNGIYVDQYLFSILKKDFLSR